METILLACKTLQDELEHAIEKAGCVYDTHWIEPGLHNTPNILRTHLQETLDSLNGINRVLMVLGLCGNAIIGLETRGFQLIIPRVDDCISLLLGSVKNRTSIGGTYFLTRGWLRGERTIWAEYQHAVNKYGKKDAESIMEMMLGNYSYIALLDTDSYDIKAIIPETEYIANELKLQLKILPATINYIYDLLTGPWDNERFYTFPPNSVISDFRLT